MNKYVPEILLWLFVINLGIAYGAGLYEKRIILPQWFSKSAESGLRVNSEAMRQTQHGTEILGLCHDSSSDPAHPGKFCRGIAVTRSKTCLVARCSGDHTSGEDWDIFFLHSDGN
jgi:hypothetical protein